MYYFCTKLFYVECIAVQAMENEDQDIDFIQSSLEPDVIINDGSVWSIHCCLF